MANYGLTLVTAPTSEPITLAEAKLQCGVADAVTFQDDAIRGLITAAREKVEADTGRALMSQTWDFTFDLFPYGMRALTLPKCPVSSVTSLKYYDQSNVQQTLSSTVYKTFLDREPPEIRLHYQQQWPFLYGEQGVITVRFVAGYATAADVPQGIVQAMMLLIQSWFEQAGGMTDVADRAYNALINRWRTGDEFTSYGRSIPWQGVPA